MYGNHSEEVDRPMLISFLRRQVFQIQEGGVRVFGQKVKNLFKLLILEQNLLKQD